MYITTVNLLVILSQVAQKVFGGEVKKHVLLFESSKADTAKANQDNLREVAKEFKGKVCLRNMYYIVDMYVSI